MSIQDDAVPEAAFFAAVRRWGIVRGPEGVIGGVISGAGARVKLAAWPSRLIVIVAAFLLFPVVMLAYAFGWAVLPDAEGRIVIQDFGRGVTNVGALIGIAIFGAVGFISFSDLRPFGRAWVGPGIAEVDPSTFVRVGAILVALLIPLVILGGLVLLVVFLARRSNAPKSAPPASGSAPIYALTPAQARAAASAYPAAAHATASAGTTTTPLASPAASSAALPAAAPRTPPPPAPSRPRAPRVPGPGTGFYLAVLAWSLIAAAGTGWASREDLLSIYPPLAWGMVFLTGLGVILIMVSLSGRKLGFLGFLGGLGMFPAFLLLVWHADLLDSYANDQGILTVTVPEVFEMSPEVDPTVEFSGDYDGVFFASSCWSSPNYDLNTFGSTALITVPAPVTEDVTHRIVASTTTVRVPAGTSLRVTSDDWTQATVFFKDRGLTCTYPGEPGDYIVLTNNDTPVVTLDVSANGMADTIVIEEN